MDIHAFMCSMQMWNARMPGILGMGMKSHPWHHENMLEYEHVPYMSLQILELIACKRTLDVERTTVALQQPFNTQRTNYTCMCTVYRFSRSVHVYVHVDTCMHTGIPTRSSCVLEWVPCTGTRVHTRVLQYVPVGARVLQYCNTVPTQVGTYYYFKTYYYFAIQCT